ncbi:MAG: dehalogenase [Dehalogenimonas sp.]
MWVIVALIIGFAIATLVFWGRSKGITLNWYEWLIGIVGLLLVLFAIQNFFEVQTEFPPTPASKFLLYVGLPGLILMAVAWQLSIRRKKTT